eukprot:993334_1
MDYVSNLEWLKLYYILALIKEQIIGVADKPTKHNTIFVIIQVYDSNMFIQSCVFWLFNKFGHYITKNPLYNRFCLKILLYPLKSSLVFFALVHVVKYVGYTVLHRISGGSDAKTHFTMLNQSQMAINKIDNMK